MTTLSRDLISVATLAVEWDCSTRHIGDLLRDGRLRGVKVGRGWRIARDDISEYLAERENRPPTRRRRRRAA